MYKIFKIKYTPIKTFSRWNFLFMFHVFSYVLKNMKFQLDLISHLISVSQMLSFFSRISSFWVERLCYWLQSFHSKYVRIHRTLILRSGRRSMVYLALEAVLSQLLLNHHLNQSNSWKHRRVAFRMRNINSKIALSRHTVARYSVHLRNFHFVPIFMLSFSVFNELREFTRALSQLPH